MHVHGSSAHPAGSLLSGQGHHRPRVTLECPWAEVGEHHGAAVAVSVSVTGQQAPPQEVSEMAVEGDPGEGVIGKEDLAAQTGIGEDPDLLEAGPETGDWAEPGGELPVDPERIGA